MTDEIDDNAMSRRTSQIDTIAKGYSDHTLVQQRAASARQRDADMARSFREDPQLEVLLRKPGHERETILAGSSHLRLSLGHYVAMKAAVERARQDAKEQS